VAGKTHEGQELAHQLSKKRLADLYSQHGRSVLTYALRRADGEDAADVAAETFLIAWRRLEEIPSGERARLWLYGVAGRVLANQRRGELRRRKLSERLRSEVRHQVDPFELGDTQHGRLLRALAKLRPEDRELLLLAGWEQLSPPQIAQVLGLSRVATRSRVHRARGRLKQILEQADESDQLPPGTTECKEAR
jgi:RNA polymerase sigma factor (sigma-70 family)